MDIWVDIEDASGNKYGSGPLRVASWESAPKLDEAGTFSFSLPASPEATALLQNKRVAHCYGILDGAVTELGMGIIDTVRLDTSTPPTLTVSGPDILAELGNVSVGDLMIREQRWTYLNDPTKGTLHCIEYVSEALPEGAWYTSDPTLCHDANLATHQVVWIHGQKVGYPESCAYLYVGYDSRYSKIRFKFHTPNAEIDPDDGLTIQYYSSEMNGWKWLVGFTDGTAIAGQGPWKQDGDIEFDPPDDWVRYNQDYGGNWFWMRIRAKNNGPDNPRYLHADIAEISVYADFPTTNGVQMIMDFAPAGWTTNPSPVMTVTEKYLTFAGESVLNALITLTEEGGQEGSEPVKEHFRLGAGRTVDWIGTTEESTGLTAVSPPNTMDESDDIVLISSLSRERDTSEVVTRVYAWSGDGIGLIGSSRTPPTGYSRGFTVFEDDPQYYVQNDAAVATYGIIERWMEFSEISQQQTNTFTTHVTYTADAVFDKAVEYLRSHAEKVEQYDLSIVRFPELLLPGKTIDCVYYEYKDGGQSIAIDTIHDSTPLWILSPRLNVDTNGVATVALEVSTLDRSSRTDADVVVDLVRERKRSLGNITNIISGSAGASVPLTAGADIRILASEISRKGRGVLVFSASGAYLREYEASAAGLATALAEAGTGDIVEIPAGTIAANVTVPAEVTLRGRGRGSIISGTVTLNGILDNCSVIQNVGSDTDVVAVIAGPGALLSHVSIQVSQYGPGKALGLLGISGEGEPPTNAYDCDIFVSGTSSSAWGYGAIAEGGLRLHQGSVVGVIPEEE